VRKQDHRKEALMETEQKAVRGSRTTFEDGRSVFVGTDGTDVFIEYSKDGFLTPIRLSPEAAYETATLIHQLMDAQ
jgi:hypothetical protein